MPTGGDILFIEASLMAGKGNLILTGHLGDVMKESARAALSWVRTHIEELGINADFEKIDVHMHVPAGAVSKDGPSAGVAMTTALVSLLTGRRVRGDVAMTGEITLRGSVLPVGGIKEKVLAAHRAGHQAGAPARPQPQGPGRHPRDHPQGPRAHLREQDEGGPGPHPGGGAGGGGGSRVPLARSHRPRLSAAARPVRPEDRPGPFAGGIPAARAATASSGAVFPSASLGRRLAVASPSTCWPLQKYVMGVTLAYPVNPGTITLTSAPFVGQERDVRSSPPSVASSSEKIARARVPQQPNFGRYRLHPAIGSARAGWRRSSGPWRWVSRASSGRSPSSGSATRWWSWPTSASCSPTRPASRRCWTTPTSSRSTTSGRSTGRTTSPWSTSRGATSSRCSRPCASAAQRLAPSLAVLIARDVARGLAYAHGLADDQGRPLSHRPPRRQPGQHHAVAHGAVKLLDFGIARITSELRLAVTRGRALRGKCPYLAPEQITNEGEADGRSDIFALGAVLWEMLTGRRLFVGSSDFEVLASVLNRDIPPPSSLVPGPAARRSTTSSCRRWPGTPTQRYA